MINLRDNADSTHELQHQTTTDIASFSFQCLIKLWEPHLYAEGAKSSQWRLQKYLNEINQSWELMSEQFSTEWDFIVWADIYLEKTVMSDWQKQKKQHNHIWVIYVNYLKVLKKNLFSDEDTDKWNIITFNVTEPHNNDIIIFWYDRLSELYCFFSASHKEISETFIWDCWWTRLSHYVLTELQHWDSTQVIRQSVHEISAQLNTIVDHEPFWSYSDFKKSCQHKSNNRDKSTTWTLYYNKSYYDKSFTEQQTSYHLLYCEKENNLWEFYQESDCDQSWNLNYLSVSEKVTTTTTQMFSESSLSHQHKDFITKNKIDVWKKVSLCIKCEVISHWTNECITEWLTAVIVTTKTNQWLAVNLQLVSLSIIDDISHLIAKQLEVNISSKSSLKKEYSYIIDNSSQGNTITQTVIDELSLQTEPYEA